MADFLKVIFQDDCTVPGAAGDTRAHSHPPHIPVLGSLTTSPSTQWKTDNLVFRETESRCGSCRGQRRGREQRRVFKARLPAFTYSALQMLATSSQPRQETTGFLYDKIDHPKRRDPKRVMAEGPQRKASSLLKCPPVGFTSCRTPAAHSPTYGLR